jgi:hypothetical protein
MEVLNAHVTVDRSKETNPVPARYLLELGPVGSLIVHSAGDHQLAMRSGRNELAQDNLDVVIWLDPTCNKIILPWLEAPLVQRAAWKMLQYIRAIR